jgi:hypothetical protein
MVHQVNMEETKQTPLTDAAVHRDSKTQLRTIMMLPYLCFFGDELSPVGCSDIAATQATPVN